MSSLSRVAPCAAGVVALACVLGAGPARAACPPQAFPSDVVLTADTTWCGDTTIAGHLTVSAGVTLTLEQAPAIAVSGDVHVEAGAVVTADGKGFAAAAGPAPGGSNGGYSGGGGGHGGHGGNGYPSGGGAWNDSGLLPALGGSGGGNGRAAGGAGGGVIRLAAGGAIVVDGALTANGLGSADVTFGGSGGGGAGGTIRLTAASVSGAGTLSARGGKAGNRINAYPHYDYGAGGGGAGGRVVVRAKAVTLPPASIDVAGGGAGGGSGYAAYAGGLGTVAFVGLAPGADPTDDTTTAGDVSLAPWHGWRFQAADGPFAWDTVAIGPGTTVVSDGSDVALTVGSLVVDGATWRTTLASVGGCNGTCPSSGGVSVTADAATLSGATLDAGPAKDWTFDVASSFQQTDGSTTGRNATFRGPIAFGFGGAAVVDASQLVVEAADLVVGAAAALRTDGRGHAAATGPGAGGSNGSYAGSGGSHGGRGGNGYGTAAGTWYGLSLLPDTLGSGGGNGRGAGGAGGGLVRVTLSGTLTLDGVLSANGASTANVTFGGTGGGGAGGTVRVRTDRIEGAGLLRANGGSAGARINTYPYYDYGAGGGGAGGRVVVRAKDVAFDLAAGASVQGGAPGSGSGYAAYAGGLGTVALVHLAPGADPSAETGRADDVALELFQGWRWQPTAEAPFAFDAITYRAGVQVCHEAAPVTLVADTFTAEAGSLWTTTVESFGGCAGTCPAASSGVVQAGTVALTGATLEGGTGNDWTFLVDGAMTQTDGLVRGRTVTLDGPVAFTFAGAAVVDARDLAVSATDLVVGASAALKTDARGQAAASGPGAGGSNGSYAGSGGSYGGRGGNGYGSAVGSYHDSALLPAAWGSGGGNGRGAGGAGGGAIRVALGGTLTLDGVLSANGGDTANVTFGGTGGGGAGGTVRVKAARVEGGGLLRANGGAAGARINTYPYYDYGAGGGGGGGRIAVRALDLAFDLGAGSSVAGGAGGGGSAYPGQPGGLGTVAFLQLDAGADTTVDAGRDDDVDLTVHHGWRFETGVDGPFAWRNVTVTPGTTVVAGGADLTLSASQLVVDGATWTTTVNSSAGCGGTCAAAANQTTVNAGTVSLSGSTLNAGTGQDWTFNVASAFEQDGGLVYGRTATFQGAAGFTFTGASAVDARDVVVAAQDLSVGPDATLRTDARGHAAAGGPGAGGSNGSYGGSGASHGGRGGNGYGTSAGTYYDSALLPTAWGSGGGNGRGAGVAGGGAIRVALAGTLTLDGALSANGAASANVTFGGSGGGGAGGTVRVKANRVEGAGVMRANGGAAGARINTYPYYDYGAGGGGAGGRIAVRAKDLALDPVASASVAGGGGGGGTAYPGQPGGLGTVAFVDLAASADTTLDLDRSGDRDLTVAHGFRFEPAVDAPLSWRHLSVRPGTTVVGANAAVTVEADTLTLDGATWDTTRESSAGCDGLCESAGATTLSVDTLTLTGATLQAGTGNDWLFQVFDAYSQAGGLVRGDDVTFSGPVAFDFTGAATVEARRLSVEGQDLTLGPDAVFTADARGYAATTGPGPGTTNGSYGGGGAGHGGRGGNGHGSTGGAEYDPVPPLEPCVVPPVELGSGGGSGRGAGAAGGGLVSVALTGTFTCDGTVRSDGAATGNVTFGGTGGGGAGGTVSVEVGALAGSGSLRARGGAAGARVNAYPYYDYGAGGGGAGGRIWIRSSTAAAWAGTPVTDADTAPVAGGGGGGGTAYPGQAGEVGTVCFGDRSGPPIIAPAIAAQTLLDGAPLLLDLTAYENDFEDGPGADGNALVWSFAGGDAAAATITLDPVTDELTVAPVSATAPWSLDLVLTLTDSDGQADTQVVTFTHQVTPYRLDLAVAPASLAADGTSTALLTATVTSPLGWSVAGKEVGFERLSGGGYVTAPAAFTDASGVASVGYVAGLAPGTVALRATLDVPSGAVTDTASVALTAADPDLAVFTLDITFHDPVTGQEIVPGDIDPVTAGEVLEVRARVRNLGGIDAPAGLAVTFEDTLVTFSPPGLSAPALVGTATLPALPAGGSTVVAIQSPFFDEGFHTMTVRVDADGDLAELSEDNNRAAQGFWIGEPSLGGDGLVATACSLDTVAGFTSGALPATYPGGGVRIWGRADYAPFLPFDPDHSQGIAALRGGLVSVTMTSAAGLPVSVSSGGTVLVPATGDAGTYRALHTIGTWPGADKTPIGQFPNRSGVDRWTFPAPQAFGCYTVEMCVTDTSFEGCCEKRFCVVPRGADLACSGVALPADGGLEVAPAIGEATTVSTTVTNRGDTPAYGVKARLLVDGAPVGTPVTVGTLVGGQTVAVTLPWTPACADGQVAVQVDFNDEIDETDESNNTCARKTADLKLSAVGATGKGSCLADVGLSVANLGAMPIGAWDGEVTITSPGGTVTTATGSWEGTGGFLVLQDLLMDEIGTWTFAAKADTPLDGGQCGQVPEQIEAANNVGTAALNLCPDPSPWRDARGANWGATLDLVVSDPVRYDQPATVTARITNRGTMALERDLEVRLTSDRGPVLETDADAGGDVKLIAASCADPLEPGASRDVTWTWTPRWLPDGEVRRLDVVVDPNGLLPECREDDNGTSRGLQMDLTPWRSALQANDPDVGPDLGYDAPPQFGQALTVTGDVYNRKSGGSAPLVVPNGEGGQTRFTVVRLDGSEAVPQDDLILSPAPGAPQALAYTWTPGAAECDVDNPVQRVKVHVDQNATYLETAEGNNVTARDLPDLVVTGLSMQTTTCQGDLYFTVGNAAGTYPMGVGSYMAQLTLTSPGGAAVTYPPAGPFTGTGTFLIQGGIDTSAHGDYVATVVVDVAATTACGDIPERNEKNNALTRTVHLCPDPSPQVVGIDVTADGPVQYDVPVGITARIHNYGNNSISTPLDVLLTSELGAVLETDADGTGDVKTVVSSCADPIDPGQEKVVSWTWVPRHSADLRELRAVVDPADLEPAECDETNNVAVRPLWLDLSPWKDYRGENYGTAIDLDVDVAPEFDAPLVATTHVFNRGPIPSPPEPPLILIPNGGADAVSRTTGVRLSGAEELVEDGFILAPAPGSPQDIDAPWLPDAAWCDAGDPLQSLRAFVDARGYFVENLETNNVTHRDLPDLVVASITRTGIVASHANLDFATANPGDGKHLGVGSHVAEGSVELPDGTLVPLASVGPFVGTGSHDLTDGFLFRQNGTYTVTVTADPPQVANACGDLPERDEQNNTRVQPFGVCPDVTPALAFGGLLQYEVPVPVHVTVTNVGNNTLIEDVQVTLSGTRAEDGLPATLDLDQNPRTAPFALGAGLDPGASTTVTFTWTPHQAEQVSAVHVHLDVLDTDPDNGDVADAECDLDNNDDEEPVSLDVTPWRHPLAWGENYIYGPNPASDRYVDILVASAPVNGVEVATTTRVSNHGSITPDDAPVLLRELRGDWQTPGDVIATLPPKLRPPAGGGADAVIPWTPQTVRSDPHPVGPLWGVQVVVDEPDVLVETHEGNNATRRLLVDLVPTDIGVPYNACVQAASPMRGEPTTITARIAKPLPPTGYAIPEMPLSPYHVTLLVDGAPYATVGPLTGVGDVTLATGVVFATAGDHTLEVRVDEDPDVAARDNLVPERNEDNNRRVETIHVHEPIPDLSPWASQEAPASSVVSVAAGQVGEPVTVTTTVFNHGETGATGVAVRLYVDGVAVDGALVDVPVGGATPVTLTWAAGTAGSHTATVVVDPDDALVECREGNNAAARAFDIRSPEICVADVAFLAKNGVAGSFTTADPGDVIVIRGTISNAATGGTAHDVAGRVLLQAGGATLELGSFFVDTLPAGATVVPTVVPNYALPSPPVALPGGGLQWTVTGTAPAIQVFTWQVLSSEPPNTTPGCATLGRPLELVAPPPPPDTDLGCVATLLQPSAAQGFTACGTGPVQVRLTRPDSGTPLAPADLASLTAFFLEGGAQVLPAVDLLAQGSYLGDGIWAVSVPVPASATGASLEVRVLAAGTDGYGCQDARGADVAPGVPDLYVYSDMIHFLSRNGDPTPFVQAAVGDQVVVAGEIGNAAGGCTAVDVTGDVFIQLGFGTVDLGTFTIPRIEPGETVPVPLTANPLLPAPPTPLAEGAFAWTVSPPSPWLNVYTYEITGSAVADSTPLDNAATKAMLVGSFGLGGGACEVAVAEPAAGAVWAVGADGTVAFTVTDAGGDPLGPDDLDQLAVFLLTPDGAAQLADPVDALAAPGAYEGGGAWTVSVPLPAGLDADEVQVAIAATLAGVDEGCDALASAELRTLSVAFVLPESAWPEAAGTATVELVLHTGAPLAEDVVVTVVDTALGTAVSPDDYGTFPSTQVTFPAGSPDGTVLPVTLTLVDDGLDEDDETVVLDLTAATGGAVVASPDRHTLTILDDDAPACACTFEGECLQDGDLASACLDDGARARCVAGEIVAASCGEDTCTDDGTELGGGSCVAVDWRCEAGACVAHESGGGDACTGAESVAVWTCEGGNTCVQATTTRTDACADTGSAAGGGTCSATNWTCQDGVLSATTTEGADTCNASGDAPSLTWYACVASDGEDADTCAPTTRSEADTCVDTGSDLGGGACAATDWRCVGDTLIATTSAGEDACDGSGDAPGLTFYACEASDGAAADTCAASTRSEADTCADSGTELGGGACAATDWACQGNTLVATVTGGDDACGGSEDAPTVSAWACATADGAVADRCEAQTAERFDACADTGDELGGGACSATDWSCAGGLLTSTGTAGEDACGGDADDAAVTAWSCVASSGSAADTCVSATTVRSDACADSGTELGGGACGAVDWTCADGRLSADESSGADTCGGDDDAPAVTFYACATKDGAKADACAPADTVRADACTDSGSELGGGACSAVDWHCSEGLLASTTSLGFDACGGDDDAPAVTFYACSAASGEVADTCAPAETVRLDACADTGTELGGGACTATDWSCADGLLASTGSSGLDACGGTVDDPAVTFYACAATSGTAADACVPADTVRSDVCLDTGDGLGGGACTATDWSCGEGDGGAGVLTAAGSAGVDACGGDADAPSVTWYACGSTDGGAAADTCQPATEAREDLCASTGTELGGGSCAAEDWDCVTPTDADGDRLVVATSEGTDVCGANGAPLDPDHPAVTRFVCHPTDGGLADACRTEVVTRHDTCTDSGTAAGGGTCQATDWTCSGGLLAGLDSAGADTCGDGSDAQTSYYVCGAADGSGADVCLAVQDAEPPSLEVFGPTGFQCPAAVEVAHVDDVCDASPTVAFSPSPDSLVPGEGAWTATYGPEGCFLDITATATDDAGQTATAWAPDVCLDCTPPDSDLALSQDDHAPSEVFAHENLDLGAVLDPQNPGWSGVASATVTLLGPGGFEVPLAGITWAPDRPVGDLLGGQALQPLSCEETAWCADGALDLGRLGAGVYGLEVQIVDVAGNVRTRTFWIELLPVPASFWCARETLLVGTQGDWFDCWCTLEHDTVAPDITNEMIDPATVYLQDEFSNDYPLDLDAPHAVLTKGLHFKAYNEQNTEQLGAALAASLGPGFGEAYVDFRCEGELYPDGTDARGFFSSDPESHAGHPQFSPRQLRVIEKNGGKK